MAIVHIPSELVWRRANHAALNRFVAAINDNEHFVVSYDPTQVQGYQWRLFIRHASHGPVFLHGHDDLEDAKAAALRHLGLDS